MLTARDFVVAAAAVAATLGLVTATSSKQQTPGQQTPGQQTPGQQTPGQTPSVMTSTAFDWNKLEARPTKVGAVRQVCQAPTPTLDELECHITTLNPGQSPHAPHRHADEEMIFIKEGTVESLVNGQRHRLGPGSVIFQSSNQMHAIKNVGGTPATYFVVKWNSPGMLRAKKQQ
jgi:XRE family transcriptional regulator, regulator of sulfur utilization